MIVPQPSNNIRADPCRGESSRKRRGEAYCLKTGVNAEADAGPTARRIRPNDRNAFLFPNKREDIGCQSTIIGFLERVAFGVEPGRQALQKPRKFALS